MSQGQLGSPPRFLNIAAQLRRHSVHLWASQKGMFFYFVRVLIMSRKAKFHFLRVFIMSLGAKWRLIFMRPHRFLLIMSRRHEMSAPGNLVS